MSITIYTSPTAFLRAAGPYLLQREPENSLLLGLASTLSEQGVPGSFQPWFLYAAEGEGAESQGVLCAWQSIPRIMGITRCDDNDTIVETARLVAPRLKGTERVIGPKPGIDLFRKTLARELSTTSARLMAQRLHVLTSVETDLPSPPTGTFRAATMDDLATVVRFVEEFKAETGEPGDGEEMARDRIPNGQIFLWDDGEPRSMAAWNGKTENGVRINFVYTPPENRGHGYATACVAAVTQLMLNEGRQFCTLYTDLANPISNSIYRKIGYRAVCDSEMYRLG